MPCLTTLANPTVPTHKISDTTWTRIASSSADLATALEPTTIIEVLLVLVGNPGSLPAQVARHLQGHSPTMPLRLVQAAFDRFDLTHLARKGGSAAC